MRLSDDPDDELLQEGVKRPPLWREVLPYLIAAAILIWIFRDIELSRFGRALLEARLWLVMPAMAVFTAVYALADILSYGNCYKWFVVPDIKVREMAATRLGSYLFHVLYTPLSTVANLVYLRRHKGAPVLWSLSANAFTSVHDLFSINLTVTAALALNFFVRAVPDLDPRWFILVSIPWAVALMYAAYWFTPVRDLGIFRRVTMNPILRSCRFARPGHYLVVLGARLSVALSGVAAHAALLYAFGIEAPLAMVAVAAPLIIGVSFMPVSGAGFGGPQLVALMLLPYAGGDKALVTAYSMSFSALFTAGRSIIGAAFLPSYLRGVRHASPRMEGDPLLKF